MADNKLFKGIQLVDGTAEGFSLSTLTDKNTMYFVRTSATKDDGYIYFNCKKYGTAAGAIATLSSGVTEDIKTLSGATSANTENIATLSGATSANTENIATLSGATSANTEAIETLSGATSANTENIATLSGATSANTENIATLSGATSANTENIATLSGATSANTENIEVLSGAVSSLTENALTAVTVNGQTATKSSNEITLDSEDITLGADLEYSGETVATSGQTIKEGIDAVVSKMVENEEVTAEAVDAVSTALGITGETVAYEAQADTTYISGATSYNDADVKLDQAISGLSSSLDTLLYFSGDDVE